MAGDVTEGNGEFVCGERTIEPLGAQPPGIETT